MSIIFFNIVIKQKETSDPKEKEKIKEIALENWKNIYWSIMIKYFEVFEIRDNIYNNI